VVAECLTSVGFWTCIVSMTFRIFSVAMITMKIHGVFKCSVIPVVDCLLDTGGLLLLVQ
jgi:hypothetical protein